MQLTRNFRSEEFSCKCGRSDCDAPEISRDLVLKLQAIRDAMGQPLKPTSGTRCKYWNQKIGGAENSYHLQGLAVDVSAAGPKKFMVVMLAIRAGITGIGVGSDYIHLDLRPMPAIWPSVRKSIP